MSTTSIAEVFDQYHAQPYDLEAVKGLALEFLTAVPARRKAILKDVDTVPMRVFLGLVNAYQKQRQARLMGYTKSRVLASLKL